MKIKPPATRAHPSLKAIHARKCFLLGIRDPDKVDRLWETERVRIETVRKEMGHVPGRRHGRR